MSGIITDNIGRSSGLLKAAAGGGITEIDLWRLTTAFSSGSWTIDANLERCDNAGFGHLGTGMSQSSGVFTFPSTGFWWVWYTQNVTANGDNRAVYARIATTHDNSTYINASLSVGEIARVENNFTGNSLTCNTILDVTDTANVKCKFTGSISNIGTTVWGNTAQNETYMTFIRLGDT